MEILIRLKGTETDLILDGLFSKEMSSLIKEELKEIPQGEKSIDGFLYETEDQKEPSFASYTIFK